MQQVVAVPHAGPHVVPQAGPDAEPPAAAHAGPPLVPQGLSRALAQRAWALLVAGVPLTLLLDLAEPDGPRSELIALRERPGAPAFG